jgi:predicted nuclease of predicted toxin-antitoxin system
MSRPSSSGVVWVDAQLPPALAQWLRTTQGIDAWHVAAVDQLAADDPAIFAAARAGRAAIVVTKDDDFVELVERLGPPPQIVWVTCGNMKNAELRAIVLEAWPRVAELLASGEPLVELGRRA